MRHSISRSQSLLLGPSLGLDLLAMSKRPTKIPTSECPVPNQSTTSLKTSALKMPPNTQQSSKEHFQNVLTSIEGRLRKLETESRTHSKILAVLMQDSQDQQSDESPIKSDVNAPPVSPPESMQPSSNAESTPQPTAKERPPKLKYGDWLRQNGYNCDDYD